MELCLEKVEVVNRDMVPVPPMILRFFCPGPGASFLRDW